MHAFLIPKRFGLPEQDAEELPRQSDFLALRSARVQLPFTLRMKKKYTNIRRRSTIAIPANIVPPLIYQCKARLAFAYTYLALEEGSTYIQFLPTERKIS